MLASGKEVSESAKSDWQYFQRSFGHRAAPGEVAGNTMAFSHFVFLLNFFQIMWAVWSRNSTAQSGWPASWRESLMDSFGPTLVMGLACSCCSECIFEAFVCYFLTRNPKSCLRLALLVMMPSGKRKKRDVYHLMLYPHVYVQFPQSMRCVCSLYLWKSSAASPHCERTVCFPHQN